MAVGESGREDFLNRQLIYTAITRAKAKVSLFAKAETFRAGQTLCHPGLRSVTGPVLSSPNPICLGQQNLACTPSCALGF